MGLNCIGPLIHRMFSINTVVHVLLHMLIEFMDVELWIWRADCEVKHGFSTARGKGGGWLAPLTPVLFRGEM